MYKLTPPLCMFVVLVSLCITKVKAQSTSTPVREGKKDTVWTVSPELIKKVQEAFLSPAPVRRIASDKEITELTDEILNKPTHKPRNGRPGMRPYSLRVDSYDELERLTAEGIKGRIVPERLMKLLKPKPLFYTDHNVWYRW